MRKSLLVALAGAVVLAVGVALFAFWLPAYHSSQAKKWNAAGERALARVALPATFVPHDDAGSSDRICTDSVDQRCFLATADPKDLLSPVGAALHSLATGEIDSACQPVPIPNSPATCEVTVPVQGSSLILDIFPQLVHNGRPLKDATWQGSYVEVRVARH